MDDGEIQSKVLRVATKMVDDLKLMVSESEEKVKRAALEHEANKTRLNGAVAFLELVQGGVLIPDAPVHEPLKIDGITVISGYRSVPDAIRSVLRSLPEQFGVSEIREEIKRRCPGWIETKGRSAISTALSSMEKKGLIEKTVEASGRGQAFYRGKATKFPRIQGHDSTSERSTGGPTV